MSAELERRFYADCPRCCDRQRVAVLSSEMRTRDFEMNSWLAYEPATAGAISPARLLDTVIYKVQCAACGTSWSVPI